MNNMLQSNGTALAFQAQSTKQLSEINDDMGEIRAGKILALSAGKYPTDADATGAFMSAAGETFPEGTFNIGGVNNGELQFGLSSADGKAYAGAGAVVLDKDGIKLELTETTYTDSSAVKWMDGADYPIRLDAILAAAFSPTIDSVIGRYAVWGTAATPNAALELSTMYNGSESGAGISLDSQRALTRAAISADEIWLTAGGLIKLDGAAVVGSDGFTPFMRGVLTGNGNNTTAGSGATIYSGFGYFGTTSTPQNVEIYFAAAATLGTFWVRTRSTQPASGSLTISVVDSSAGVYATIVIPANTAAGIFSVAASTPAWPGNEKFRVKIVNAATAASAQIAGFSLDYS